MQDGGRRLDPLAMALLALRIVVVASVIVDVPHYPSAAANRFWSIAHTPGVPYRDFAVEYPFGELGVIALVGSSTLAAARIWLAVLAFAGDLLAFGSILWGWGRRAAVRYLILGTPLLIFIYRRSDLVAVGLAALGFALVHRDRERSGGAWLGVAALVKLWPIALAPALVVARRVRSLGAFAVTVLVGLVGWVAFGGPDAVRQVATFRGASGWELESSIGAVVWAVTGEHRFEAGANRTGVIPGWARVAMIVAVVAVLVAVWLRARRHRSDVAGAPALAAVASLLVLSPLLSPQYVSWLLPWGAVAGAAGRRWLLLAAAPCTLTGAIVASWYLDLALGPGWNQALLTARNALLLAIPVVWLSARPDG